MTDDADGKKTFESVEFNFSIYKFLIYRNIDEVPVISKKGLIVGAEY
jgi:hypothetical protein